MSESFSTVTVLGALRQPVQMQTFPSGSQCGTFDLLLREQTAAGSWFTVVVPCQVWGKGVEVSRTLRRGQPCVFTGKLARCKTQEGYVLGVSGFSLEPLDLPVPLPDAAALSRN
jgi:hypothetical protein